ncbi:MAG: signal peptidase I [Planctomycetales bacterium]
MESVVVAFVLAFLFRTFEAEAFVIPTGSMAPTLFGQHRDIYCEECGTRFAVGASTGTSNDPEVREGYIVSHNRSKFGICANANCRFPNNLLDREIFAGDRILVNKFPYEFGNPERFDVVVFKFPEGAKTNYIKRLIGLPGEEVRLEGGDVKVRPLDSLGVYRTARKPPDKQRLLQMLVHDNDHPATRLLEAGWPEAWSPQGDSAWSPDPAARAFRIDPSPDDPEREAWLRYTHYVPHASDWEAIKDPPRGAKPQIRQPPQPQEILDYYAYNARISVQDARGRGAALKPNEYGTHWVGDLTLTTTVEVLSPQGTLLLELVEGDRRYRCQFDLATGRGQLTYRTEQGQDDEPFPPAGEPFDTQLKSGGKSEVCFANVDDRLCVWVGGTLVKTLEFEENSKYEPPRQPVDPTEADRSPVGIAAIGARLRVSHLKIERDVFYLDEQPMNGRGDRAHPYRLLDSDDDQEDQFLMLGDNSPRSNDSRLWNQSFAVPRRLLIGRAFFIYWPHGVPFLNDGRGFALGKYHERLKDADEEDVPIPKMSAPFYPQVGRMQRIR